MRRLTEEDSHIVLALDKGLKSAGCYILNLIITVIIMKILINSLIVVTVMLLKMFDFFVDLLLKFVRRHGYDKNVISYNIYFGSINSQVKSLHSFLFLVCVNK